MGGRRPGGLIPACHVKQDAIGIDYVVVNGEVLLEEGEHTGALPGPAMPSERPGRSGGTTKVIPTAVRNLGERPQRHRLSQ